MMKTPRIIIGAFAVCCAFALVIGMASAAGMTQHGTGNNLKIGAAQSGPEQIIDRLEQQGIDVTEARTALQNGDTEALNVWLHSYRESHHDELAAKGTANGPMTGQAGSEGLLLMLDNLTAQGYDVTAIRAAVESGDFETARSLMREFRSTYPDAFPAGGEGAGNGHHGGKLRALNQ